MAVNRNWCRTDGARLEYAPTWLMTDEGLVVNPSSEQYIAAGWLANAVTPPQPPEGQMVAATRYVAHDGRVVAVYDYEPIKPTVDDYNRAVEDHLMAERMERGYDTREPSLYINSSVHRWSQDAVDWVRHVDAVMTFALGVLNGWEKTHEVMSLDEFRAAIPRIEWTEKDND